MSGCSAPTVSRPLPSPPPCGAGRDIKYGVTPHHGGPWPNKCSLVRSSFHDLHTNGLADLATPPPDEFSWRTKAPDQIEDGHRNQAVCGSCWSFSVASTLGDRYALANGIKSPYPSVAFLLAGVGGMPQLGAKPNQICCCGGDVQTGAEWLQDNYLKLEDCWPYSFIQETTRTCPAEAGDKAPPTQEYVAPDDLSKVPDNCCASCCGNSEAKPRFSVAPGSVKALRALNSDGTVDVARTILAIKQDILQNGPISTSIQVPANFMDFWHNSVVPGKTDVFVPQAPSVGGHAIVLTGWGGPPGQQWWEVRNSWGPPGFMRFLMTTPTTPVQLRTGIDAPINIGASGQSSPGPPNFGGAVSFLPGALTAGYSFPKAAGGKLTKPGQASGFSMGESKTFLIVGIAVVITIGIVTLILMNKKPGTSHHKRH